MEASIQRIYATGAVCALPRAPYHIIEPAARCSENVVFVDVVVHLKERIGSYHSARRRCARVYRRVRGGGEQVRRKVLRPETALVDVVLLLYPPRLAECRAELLLCLAVQILLSRLQLQLTS